MEGTQIMQILNHRHPPTVSKRAHEDSEHARGVLVFAPTCTPACSLAGGLKARCVVVRPFWNCVPVVGWYKSRHAAMMKHVSSQSTSTSYVPFRLLVLVLWSLPGTAPGRAVAAAVRRSLPPPAVQSGRQPTCCLLSGLSTHPWIHIVGLNRRVQRMHPVGSLSRRTFGDLSASFVSAMARGFR